MELKAKDLDYSVPLEKIQEFRKTKLDETVIGQPRALKALQFGVGINAKGYNIFVIGDSGTGKRSTVRKVLTKYRNRRPLKDVVCVCNFSDADSPNIIYLQKGKGIDFYLVNIRLNRYAAPIKRSTSSPRNVSKVVTSFLIMDLLSWRVMPTGHKHW